MLRPYDAAFERGSPFRRIRRAAVVSSAQRLIEVLV